MIQFIETVKEGMFNRMSVCLVTITGPYSDLHAYVRLPSNHGFGVHGDEASALVDSMKPMPGMCDVQTFLINLVQVARVVSKTGSDTIRHTKVWFIDGTQWSTRADEAVRIHDAIIGQKRLWDAQMQAMAAMMQRQSNLVQPASNFTGAFRK